MLNNRCNTMCITQKFNDGLFCKLVQNKSGVKCKQEVADKKLEINHTFQEKKMVYLILSLLLLPFINVTSSINLTYIVKKDGNKIQPSCIAEELERYAAVGWVYPIPSTDQDLPNITTKFIPTIKNNYNCKFSKTDFCNQRWLLRDWTIDSTSIRTHDFIGDRRWEDLPTIFISNTTKEFKERMELSKVFRNGFSVRANGITELFVCSGWNPYSYPCYYFNIDNREIYFNKFSMLPKNSLYDFKSNYLEHYKGFSNILSHDEWRSFVISIDESKVIELVDVNLNRTLIKHADKEPLNPEFLFMRSRYGSLWKIHENHFLYTNTTQVSRLGPQLTVTSKDLCVSLLIITCDNCEMIFFYQNASVRKVLKYVGPMENNEWVEIKLKEENIQTDKLNIFVETKFKDMTLNKTAGFWAVDDVRICNENEVKVSYLKLNSTVKEDEVTEEYISCQLIKKPSWRPKQLLYKKTKDFPEVLITNNSTTIRLSWTQEDPTNQMINYFIFYQANDICVSEPYNLRRKKSNGFLTTKHNEIVIDELVPYTTYNITFSSVLHETDKQLYLNTLETEEPTLEELPYKVQVRASDSIVYVSWEIVNCTYKYGRLIYSLIVTNENLNFTKELLLQTDNKYKIGGLEPYTPYSLRIQTARNGGNIYRGIRTSSIVLNFTTLAGVAPPIKNLELYSIDQSSASLRFDMPKNSKGIPREIQVSKCIALSFDKCKTYASQLKRCLLWPNKYCVIINNLIPYKRYLFKISLKNFNTQTYGKEVEIQGFTIDQVPGAPTNIKYQIVGCDVSTDYCHLNVIWYHPYNENGTITTFNIILNSTDKHKNSEEDKYIHEVYRVENKLYLSNYTYQIKYLPYSTSYILYLQSANAVYKSNFTKLTVKTDNIGDHIDQSPKLLGKSDSTLLFKIPHLDRRLNFYTLVIIVQDFDRNKTVEPTLMENNKIADNICHKYGDTWISHILKVEDNDTKNVMIGNSEKGKIKPKTQYCITFIITNKYKKSEHDVVYYEKLITPDSSASVPPREISSSSSYNHLYILLVLLVLVPIGFLIYRYLRKRRIVQKPIENNDNVYESLPFEECETNCVNNDNYDHLLHK